MQGRKGNEGGADQTEGSVKDWLREYSRRLARTGRL